VVNQKVICFTSSRDWCLALSSKTRKL